MVYGFTVMNGKAWFVVEYQGEGDELTISSISVLALDDPSYATIYTKVQLQANAYELGNLAMPDVRHNAIHAELERLAKRSPQATMGDPRHFHWVRVEPMSADQFGGFLVKVKDCLGDQFNPVLAALGREFKN